MQFNLNTYKIMKKLLAVMAVLAVAMFAADDVLAQEVKSLKIDEVLADGE